jgi:hypothetical protein
MQGRGTGSRGLSGSWWSIKRKRVGAIHVVFRVGAIHVVFTVGSRQGRGNCTVLLYCTLYSTVPVHRVGAIHVVFRVGAGSGQLYCTVLLYCRTLYST